MLRTLPGGPQLAEAAPGESAVDRTRPCIRRYIPDRRNPCAQRSASQSFVLSCFCPDWRADFRNAVVAIERAGIWQFGLGCGVDSLQFHGRPGAGKRDRCIIENSAVASTSFYALLEVLVAVLGCTIVFGLPALGELLRPVWQMLWNYQPTLLGLRFIVSFLILLCRQRRWA